MTRAVLWLLRLLLRVFFRHVEIIGQAQLPREGGIVFAPNHPNGLVDPLFLLTLPDRPVSFLAKEPLFHMPVVAVFVRALRCLPVYRARDGHDTNANVRTLAAARAQLEAGFAIGIFPEGTSHSASALSPLKTGAARIALGSRAGSDRPVYIVPCALHYSDKATFRSYAALVYGPPIEVPRVPLDEHGEPPRPAARALTERVKAGLDELVPQAESVQVLQLVATATRLFEGVRRARREQAPLPQLDASPVAGEVERRWRLSLHMLQRYAQLKEQDPALVAELSGQLMALEAALQPYGLDLRDPLPSGGSDLPHRSKQVWKLLVAAPFALAGVVLHYFMYRAIGVLALRASKQEQDVVATAKLLIGLLAFPAWWLLLAVLAGVQLGALAGVAALLAQPALAWLALVWSEQLEAWQRGRRIARGAAEGQLARLVIERDRLYERLVELDEDLQMHET